MTLIIKKINPKDIEFVNSLICDAFNADPNLVTQKEFLTQPQIHCFTASTDGKIIGTATLHVVQKTNRKLGLIEDVVVAPNTQGKGVGKALIEKLIAESKALDCYKVILSSKEKNVPFYERYGFSVNEIQMVIKH